METPEKKRVIMARLVRRGSPEADAFDNEFWARVGHEAKFEAAWRMVNEVRLIRGEQNVGQSRLQRSVQHIKRRSG